MAKFCGKIGFGDFIESSPGIWTETIVEKTYYGDTLRISKKNQQGSGLNDNININNEISIIADPFANNNLQNIRYVNWMGANWEVTNVTVQYPRLTLSIGGVYNGKPATITQPPENNS